MPFWELTVPVSSEVSEGLTNFLWEQGALGLVEEEKPGSSPRIQAFFPETSSSTAIARAVSDYLASLRVLGMPINGEEPRITPLLDEPWAEAWRQAFTPQRIGRRLLILPPWEVPAADENRTTVIIEPGRAFGTGTHGSTRGCLVLLEAVLNRQPVAQALDIGAGTGILAIAAVALGVPRVTALDMDPDAVAAARANAARNGMAERITCALGEAASLESLPLQLILANLLAGSHLAHASEYRRLAIPGGQLILGGILSDEVSPIRKALGAHGFTLTESAEMDGWVSLHLSG